jgi:hypothetical protein
MSDAGPTCRRASRDTLIVALHQRRSTEDRMADHDDDRVTARVRREYLEMPGLSLTEEQAARLWQLSRHESEGLLRRLVEEHFLVQARTGHFRRGSPA